MQSRSAVMVGTLLLAFSLSACATPAPGAGVAASGVPNDPSATSEPTPTRSPSTDAPALAQAQAWLDAATLPPEAVRSEVPVGIYNSYTGWPCGPYEELEAFWTIPGATVSGTANWLREHPTADLLTTSPMPMSDDPVIDSAIVGYIPAPDSQEGVVYTIVKTGDGVAVRAEIAAMTDSGECSPPPGGGTWGAPGQG